MRAALTMLLTLSLLGGCSKSTDPNTAAYWVERLDDKPQRLEALKNLARIGDKSAAPAVLTWLEKEGEWQPDAAFTLGQLNDPSVVPQLVAKLDYQVGTGSDRSSRLKNRVNINIIRALASLKAKDSADKIINLLNAAEPTVREAAIKGLGALGNPVATAKLREIARNDSEPFLRKVAIQALGELRDPNAVPTLVEMLYVEMPNVSFYYEARFSLIQIGQPAVSVLLETLNRKNQKVEEIRMTDGSKIGEGAIEAKAASVLGYLRAKEAEPKIVETIATLYKKFQKRNEAPIFASVQGAIIEMCYALANLGTAEATKMLTILANDTDANVRMAACESLTQLGNREANKVLLAAVKTGDAVARRAALTAASRLSDGGDLPAIDALAKAGDKEVPTEVMAQLVTDERARFEAAKECKQNVTCWRGKLTDQNPKIRDKAAWELGWAANKEALDDLMKAAEDPDPMVRMAAVISLGRFEHTDTKKLEAIYDAWQSKLEYMVVNQELGRLIARVKNSNGKR